MQMNWKIGALLGVAALAIIVAVSMGGEKVPAPVASNTPVLTTIPTPANEAPVISPEVTLVSTGDPAEDILATLNAESVADGLILDDAASDVALVASDGAELSALTTAYDANEF